MGRWCLTFSLCLNHWICTLALGVSSYLQNSHYLFIYLWLQSYSSLLRKQKRIMKLPYVFIYISFLWIHLFVYSFIHSFLFFPKPFKLHNANSRKSEKPLHKEKCTLFSLSAVRKIQGFIFVISHPLTSRRDISSNTKNATRCRNTAGLRAETESFNQNV